jgi:DNA modification methylase
LSAVLVTAPEVAPPQVVLRRIESLRAYEKNSRTHSKKSIAQLADLIESVGYTSPVLIDGEDVAAGHGRIAAVSLMHDKGRLVRFPNGSVIPAGFIPTIDCTGWTEEQRRAYVIADNQVALNAGWDKDLLAGELADLSAAGFNMGLLGFDEKSLQTMLPTAIREGLTHPDEMPETVLDVHSALGDIWLLGAHRVICGDSTAGATWEFLMGEEQADICWTDPPYNVAYESKLAGKIQNDDMSDADFYVLIRGMMGAVFAVMKPGAAIYVAHADTEGLNFRKAFCDAGFKLSGCLVWKKDSLVLGRSDYQWMHEPILYGWKPGAAHRWFGGRKQTTVAEFGDEGPIKQRDDGKWQISVGDSILIVDGTATVEEMPSSVIFHEKPKRSSEHPTMKPVGLIEKQLKSSARPGDVVIDCCGRSGSTLIAAERLGMKARLSELEPKFVDVIVRRWQQFTGQRAVHAVTGEPFPAE